MTLHQQLKASTATLHNEIEKNDVLKAVLTAQLSRDQYVLILQKFLSFIEPLENQIKALNLKNLNCHLNKSEWLKKDLIALEIEPSSNEKAFSNVDSEAKALGILYVIEGSMLGGQFIGKQLRNFDFIRPENSRYYNGYGEKTRDNWKGFLENLSFFEQKKPTEVQAVVDAAIETFKALDKCFKTPVTQT